MPESAPSGSLSPTSTPSSTASPTCSHVLGSGRDVAVVTDAGTPGVSDPGERLVRAAIDGGYTVAAVPGPVAAVTALIISGLPTDRYVFDGFLPRSGSLRARRLGEIADERRTIVLYEAPHRIARTMKRSAGGVRPQSARRDLPRAHQTVRTGRARHARRDRHRGAARRVRDRARRTSPTTTARSTTTRSAGHSVPSSPAAPPRRMPSQRSHGVSAYRRSGSTRWRSPNRHDHRPPANPSDRSTSVPSRA